MKIIASVIWFLCLHSFAMGQSNTVEIWIRAFIPNAQNSGAASDYIKANPLGGTFVRLHTRDLPNVCFKTDDRGFSTSSNISSRAETRFTLELKKNGSAVIAPNSNRSLANATTQVDCNSGSTLQVGNGHLAADNMSTPAVADNVVQVIGNVQATNVLTVLGKAAPSIDYNYDIQWNPSSAKLKVACSFGAFPAFEVYARQPGCDWTAVINNIPTSSPWGLMGDVWGVSTERLEKEVALPGMSGNWSVTSEDRRFQLEIGTTTVKWTERNLQGAQLVVTVPIVEQEDHSFVISRPNTNEVLAFLGFQTTLRNDILARGPNHSFIKLSWDGKNIKGEWYGLLATKDNNGRLRELIQPGTRPPKIFTFNKQNN